MECLSTVNVGRRRTTTDVETALSRVQHFLDAHPSPLNSDVERHMKDVLVKVNNPRLDEMWTTAKQR